MKKFKTKDGKNDVRQVQTKQSRVFDLIPEKVRFKVKSTEEDTEGHYRNIKGTIYEEDLKDIKLHAPVRQQLNI